MDLLFIILVCLVIIGIASVFIVVKVDRKMSNVKESISNKNKEKKD